MNASSSATGAAKLKDIEQMALDGIMLSLEIHGNDKVANAPIFLRVSVLLINELLLEPFPKEAQEDMFAIVTAELFKSVLDRIENACFQINSPTVTTKRRLIIRLLEMCIARGTLRAYET